tara:strand:+ start:162 stop:431 length:270 start_codon:yes stop_codon:yes gene_type:complete
MGYQMDAEMVNYSRLKNKQGPCPACELHINVGDTACVHCNHILTSYELASVKKYAASQKLKGTKIALLFFPIAIFFIYLIFALIQYNEI